MDCNVTVMVRLNEGVEVQPLSLDDVCLGYIFCLMDRMRLGCGT